jgi:hypothetical protein
VTREDSGKLRQLTKPQQQTGQNVILYAPNYGNLATQSAEAAGYTVVKNLNDLKKALWKFGGQSYQ